MVMVFPRKCPGAIEQRLHHQTGLQGQGGPGAFETLVLFLASSVAEGMLTPREDSVPGSSGQRRGELQHCTLL